MYVQARKPLLTDGRMHSCIDGLMSQMVTIGRLPLFVTRAK